MNKTTHRVRLAAVASVFALSTMSLTSMASIAQADYDGPQESEQSDDDRDEARKPTIVELAVATPDLSILVAAVKRAGLVDTLNSGRYTVFAPTNAAFVKLLPQVGATKLEDIPVETLKAVLLDHVVVGKLGSKRLSNYDRRDITPNAIGGLAIDFDRSPAAVNNANVVAADIKARNGVVHVIDTVLLDPDPRPNVVNIAISNPNFSILVQAVSKAGLVDALKNSPKVTVFAPTNQAFTNLLAQVGAKSLDDIPVDQLRAILLDHVVAGEQDAVDVLERGRFRSLGGLRLNINRSPLQINGVNIVATDVEGKNGTIHVLDGVILRSKH